MVKNDITVKKQNSKNKKGGNLIMKRIVSLLLSMLMLVSVFTGVSITALADDSNSNTYSVKYTGTADYEQAYAVLTLVNKARANKGLDPLTMDKTLLDNAMQRAAELNLYPSHTRPSGGTAMGNMSGAICGENVAYGYTSANAVHTAWMSDEHKVNILNSSAKSIGVGCVNNQWVELFSENEGTSVSQPKNTSKTFTINVNIGFYNSIGIDDGEDLDDDADDFDTVIGNTYMVYSELCDTNNIGGGVSVDADNFTWSISNSSVATVSVPSGKDYALVTMHNPGTCKLTATFTQKFGDGSKSTVSYSMTITTNISSDSNYTFTSGNLKYKALETSYRRNTTNPTYEVVVTGGSKNTITTADIPSAVTYNGTKYNVVGIADNAFKNYTKLKTATIPTSVTSIGKCAFYGCTALTTIKIPSGITTLSQKVFARCTALKTVTGCTGLTKIDKYAFYNCTSLQKVKGCAKVTSIGAKAFVRCKKLTQVGTDTGVTTLTKLKTLGSYAFYDCSSLTTIKLPSAVTEIKLKTFVRCTSLKSVTGCTSIKYIDDYAFYKCGKLKNVNSCSNVLIVGNKAFAHCKALVRIGSTKSTVSLTKASIEAYAFYGCKNISRIDLESTLPATLEYHALRGLSSTCRFYVDGKQVVPRGCYL